LVALKAAEYGGREPSWIAAVCSFWAAIGFLFWISNARISAVREGVVAVSPQATGLFHWQGVNYLPTVATFTFVNEKSTEHGGRWLPLGYLCVVGLAILPGRLWRVFPAWRRQYAFGTSGG